MTKMQLPQGTAEFEHPNGERLIITKSGQETSGELLEMEAFYNPNSSPPPLHLHPHQEEQFEVLSGRFHVRLDELERTYHPGDRFTVPAGTPHLMHNISDEVGHLRWQIRPALQSEAFFKTMWGLSAQGKLNILQLAVILRAYRQEFRALQPAPWIQSILFGLLAPVGWLAGHRPRYEQTE